LGDAAIWATLINRPSSSFRDDVTLDGRINNQDEQGCRAPRICEPSTSLAACIWKRRDWNITHSTGQFRKWNAILAVGKSIEGGIS
jgi:hypothetical protein